MLGFSFDDHAIPYTGGDMIVPTGLRRTYSIGLQYNDKKQTVAAAMAWEQIGSLSFKGISENGIVEIGYGINDGYENKGYTTEAVGAVVKWAAKQPNVNQIEAEAEESNPASIRVLEKCNFIPNGEMGEEGIRFVWKE